MVTQVVMVNGQVGLAEAVRQGIEVLNRGGLVVFPTETVYGVAGRADKIETIVRLRQVKGRSNEKALTVHLGTKEDAGKYVHGIPGVAQRLIRKGWPGPLTLVLAVEDAGTTEVGAGLSAECREAIFYSGTVGLRCPDDPIAE
ncbi:MAG: Sua5/YciO/YrdC/YwlC family protein, partial [Planctomycetota bacterium]